MGQYEARIRRLERLSVFGLVSLLLCGIVLLVGQARPRPPISRSSEDVVAERFVLKDREGRVRAVLGPDSQGQFGLYLFDRNNLVRLRLETWPAGEEWGVHHESMDLPRFSLFGDEVAGRGQLQALLALKRGVQLSDYSLPSLELYAGSRCQFKAP